MQLAMTNNCHKGCSYVQDADRLSPTQSIITRTLTWSKSGSPLYVKRKSTNPISWKLNPNPNQKTSSEPKPRTQNPFQTLIKFKPQFKTYINLPQLALTKNLFQRKLLYLGHRWKRSSPWDKNPKCKLWLANPHQNRTLIQINPNFEPKTYFNNRNKTT